MSSCDTGTDDTRVKMWPLFILQKDVEHQYAFDKLQCNPPCQQGTCIGLNTCMCNDGSTDEFCANTPCPGCNNTHGKCLQSAANGGYTCTCETGWGGETCNDQDSNTPHIVPATPTHLPGTVQYKNGLWEIVAEGVGDTVAAAATAAIIYKNWSKIRPYTRNTYNYKEDCTA